MREIFVVLIGSALFTTQVTFGQTKSEERKDAVASASGQEAKNSLLSEAKITEDEAKATAVRHVKGVVQKIELEKEHGTLVYSVDVRVGTKLVEVQIDAKTGAFLKTETEENEKGDDD
jgi:uncharacterized membrane protein YkoI